MPPVEIHLFSIVMLLTCGVDSFPRNLKYFDPGPQANRGRTEAFLEFLKAPRHALSHSRACSTN